MADRPVDRSFGPTVLLGVAGSGLSALASAQDWARARGDAAGVPVRAAVAGTDSAPLVLALTLVALAAWGVVLVLRGRARRVISVVGGAAAVGALAATVAASGTAQDAAVRALAGRGATGNVAAASLTPWWFATVAGTCLAVAAFVVSARRSPGWPAMGTRYDAPAARAEGAPAETDLWRSLDQGHDPTA